MRMFLFFLGVSTLLFSFNTVISDNKTLYSTIQPMNMASLEWIDEEWPNESNHNYMMRCLDYQSNPAPAKKRRAAFKILDSATAYMSNQDHNAMADLTTARDINLLCGSKVDAPYLAGLVCRTKTELGRVFFYGLLSSPTHEIATLEKRQAITKMLTNNTKLYDSLEAAFTECAFFENLLLSFWEQDNFFQSTKRHYFALPFISNIEEKLNCSTTALGMRSYLNHGNRYFYFATGVFAGLLLPIAAVYKLHTAQLPYFHCPGCDQEIPLQGPRTGIINYLKTAADQLQGSGGRIFGLLSGFKKYPTIAAAAGINAGLYCLLGTKEDWEWAQDNMTLYKCVQTKMHAIAHFFAIVKHLHHILEEFPAFVEETPAAQALMKFCTTTLKTDPVLAQLVPLLETGTFTDDPSKISHHGRVLVAFRLMYKAKKTLEPLLLALAELDAAVSVATIYNEFSEKRVRFCFPSYKKDNQPALRMRGFWNPFISPKIVVANDVSLQGPHGRNMVITGPNAGGKSTLIRSIVNNLFLAQSLALAAAEEMECTPFYAIGTYLNVVDDIAAGNSLFKAQVKRAQQIIDIVEKTPADCHAFVAVDEMFNGTSAKESKAAAFSVGKNIGAHSNVICILATHYPLLSLLPKQSPAFENYKVSVQLDDCSIHYPFKLEKGISNQHIALDILRNEGFACSIVDEAMGLVHKKNSRS